MNKENASKLWKITQVAGDYLMITSDKPNTIIVKVKVGNETLYSEIDFK